MSTSSTCLVEIDGTPLPPDMAPLLSSAFVDDSQQLPDMFVLRFRDPGRIVLEKTGARIGSTIRISVQTSGSAAPEDLLHGEVTALEAEFDTGGTFTVIRGYDQTHRLFRQRRTQSYSQVTAADIATEVAQRHGFTLGKVEATPTVFAHVSQAGQTDWELLSGLARDSRREIAIRQGSFSFSAPTTAADAPEASESASRNPLVIQLGRDLLRFRSVLTSAQQAANVEVRGWDVATKKALTATEPTATGNVDLPTVTPADLAKAFGDVTHVSADTPYRSQAEVDEAAKALSEELAGAFAEFEGVARGNPRIRAGAPISVDGLGIPFDGKYTVTTSRHCFDPGAGYTTAFSVTGSHDRTMLGLTSGGGRSTQAPAGVVIAQVSDVSDPEKMGRVKLVFPWLSDDYVSDWARTVQPGAGRDRGWTVLPEVGDEVLVCFEQGDFGRPNVIGGLFNGVDTVPAGPVDLVDSGSGAVNRRSIVSRRGHRIDLLDADDRTEGIRLASSDEKLTLTLDSVGSVITMHADGTVVIEGSMGITIDSASADMQLRGGKISLTATQGVDVDGGGGPVSVSAGGPLSLKGATATLEGSATTEVKGGAMCSISASMIKIN
ncbi:MAG: VgrG-related protein [Arachnia sp.]